MRIHSMLLFGACGFGVTRLLLPASLRRHELLWALPTGACVAGLALMVLGFAAVPFTAPRAQVAAALRQAKRRVALAAGIADVGGMWGQAAVTAALSELAERALRPRSPRTC